MSSQPSLSKSMRPIPEPLVSTMKFFSGTPILCSQPASPAVLVTSSNTTGPLSTNPPAVIGRFSSSYTGAAPNPPAMPLIPLCGGLAGGCACCAWPLPGRERTVIRPLQTRLRKNKDDDLPTRCSVSYRRWCKGAVPGGVRSGASKGTATRLGASAASNQSRGSNEQENRADSMRDPHRQRPFRPVRQQRILLVGIEMGIHLCRPDNNFMERYRANIPLLRHMATGDQYRHYHRYLPHGLSYPEHPEPRCARHQSQT